MKAIAIGILMVSFGTMARATVTKADFGKAPDGHIVEVYTLTSGQVEARVITYGAKLISVRAPDQNGRVADVTLGYDTLPEWLADGKTHLGAVVGRYGNRIAKGVFSLDGHTHQIPVNNNGNALHGGTDGFDKKFWNARLVPDGVEITLISPDGDMGFPGTLTAKVTYTLVKKNLTIHYEETSDKPMIVNLTNHTYFNLTGDEKEDVLGHVLTLHAQAFTPIDNTLIPTGEIRNVQGTPMDFHTFHPRFFVPVRSDRPQRYFSSGSPPERCADDSEEQRSSRQKRAFANGSCDSGDRIMLTRRKFLGKAMKISAGWAFGRNAVSFADATPSLTLKLSKTPPVSVPANFTGLGYEMSSVAPLGLLSATNHRYVELIKGLGPEGVIRVGGIVANYTKYEPNGTIAADRQNTVITRASLDQFAAFLKKIGWTTIWSVNFAQGTIQEAVDEARAVSSVLGSRLLALEIGNEIENYYRGQKPFRKAPYDYETYRKEYNEWRDAILKAVPGISFAAPDTATSVEWVERMAADAKGDVQLLATHYYRNGQARGSAEQILAPDPHLKDVLIRLRTASEQSKTPWRMCETNSFSGGGLPGVSNTFIGALWTLDFMLLLAQYGCAGVNIETGVNQLGFISSYSPIEDDTKGVNSAGVPYYGMLAFATAMAGCHQVLPLDFDAQGINLTAYALGDGERPRSVVVINRDGAQGAHLSLAELGTGAVTALRMTASSPDNKTDVIFGGAAVAPDGRWKAKTQEHIRDGTVTLPKMSAIVLRFH